MTRRRPLPPSRVARGYPAQGNDVSSVLLPVMPGALRVTVTLTADALILGLGRGDEAQPLLAALGRMGHRDSVMVFALRERGAPVEPLYGGYTPPDQWGSRVRRHF